MVRGVLHAWRPSGRGRQIGEGALVAVTDAQDRAHVDLERENG